MCPARRCAQYECVSHLAPAVHIPSQPEPRTPVQLSDDDSDVDEKQQPPQRQPSGRHSFSPLLYSDDQTAQRFLDANDRLVQRVIHASAAEAEAPSDQAPPVVAHLPAVADIASHRLLYTAVPYALHPLWIDRCKPEFESYRRAFVTEDVDDKAAALIRILQLPGKYLVKQRVSTHVRRMLRKQKRAGSEWQTERLRELLRGSIAPRAALHPPPAAPGTIASSDSDEESDDEVKYEDSESDSDDSDDPFEVSDMDTVTADDLRAVMRANSLMKEGHVNMASRAVSTDQRTLDCSDPMVLQQLRAMHPPASTAAVPALPLNTLDPAVFGGSQLGHLVRRCNNGKAGGPSGWNGAHLAILSVSRTCMEGLRCILQDMASGTLPAVVRPHMSATRLVALGKPNGSPRPIAMGELFYRIVAVRAVHEVQDQTARLLAPHQYGIGVPGGCEHIVHCMQHSLTDLSAGRPQAAVKIDISNAFNTCQRPRLLSAVLATPELGSIQRLVHWAYSELTTLVPQCKGPVDDSNFIESANGVRQGDPLSSLLFCLYLKPAIDALVAEPGFGRLITVYAYIDVGAVARRVPPSCLFCFANQIDRSVTHVLSGCGPRHLSPLSPHDGGPCGSCRSHSVEDDVESGVVRRVSSRCTLCRYCCCLTLSLRCRFPRRPSRPGRGGRRGGEGGSR